MDFYSGPAVLLVDGEAYDVVAFIDSARAPNVEEWGGYLETGPYGDVARFRAFGSEDVWIRIPGVPARDIEVTYTEEAGFAFAGLGRSPLPAFSE
ncbi:hypothetical protein ACFW2V_13155 [Streptomyces sp. NPDC058947]|uniref:hypothetical protein n=1 Tax=Streptomyces sp. NPDC058947 TaxID=3346675 RepID=UPI0036B18ED2